MNFKKIVLAHSFSFVQWIVIKISKHVHYFFLLFIIMENANSEGPIQSVSNTTLWHCHLEMHSIIKFLLDDFLLGPRWGFFFTIKTDFIILAHIQKFMVIFLETTCKHDDFILIVFFSITLFSSYNSFYTGCH